MEDDLAQDITIATFDGNRHLNHTWIEENDPVMGGKSNGNF